MNACIAFLALSLSCATCKCVRTLFLCIYKDGGVGVDARNEFREDIGMWNWGMDEIRCGDESDGWDGLRKTLRWG